MYTCHLCKKTVDNKGKYFFIGCWSPERKGNHVTYYHDECFAALAGREYIKELDSLAPQPIAPHYIQHADDLQVVGTSSYNLQINEDGTYYLNWDGVSGSLITIT
jgi:hypothetical protein